MLIGKAQVKIQFKIQLKNKPKLILNLGLRNFSFLLNNSPHKFMFMAPTLLHSYCSKNSVLVIKIILYFQIPTMIVYGSKDTGIGAVSLKSLRHMPNSDIMPMEGHGHPCYIEDPDEWHRLLYNYLLTVETS